MAAAYINSELDSRKGIKGLIKKVGYVALIATAMIADQVITEGAGFLGFDLPMKGFFALLVIFWLLINEMISILENLGRVGIERPAFFVKILERLKQIVDQKGNKSMAKVVAKGIDISSHQGTPDFKKVKAAGYSFVIIKAGQGLREMATFKELFCPL